MVNVEARLASISLRVINLILHISGITLFSYGIYYDLKYIKPSEMTDLKDVAAFQILFSHFGGKFKFLTFINVLIQLAYFSISLLNDIMNKFFPQRVKVVQGIQAYVFASLAFPLASFVAIVFWTLYAINRELVFPKIMDSVFPSWFNHIMHTSVFVFILIEMLSAYRCYPKRSKALIGLFTFVVFYLSWIHVVKYYTGFWVYPVLDVLELPMRIIFFGFVISFAFVFYLVGEYLNSIIWERVHNRQKFC